ncbi:MAG: hypothetical protein ABID87_08250 [Chloroflexota bacterium]
MENAEIARIFYDIAEILTRRKDNIFKIRAYRKVARSIEELPVPVSRLAAEGRLREIPGAGEAITGKISELLTTGKLAYYERLHEEAGEERVGPEKR